MTQADASQISEMDEMAAIEELPEMHIYSHSPIFYWWPVWAMGFVMAGWTFLRGGLVELDAAREEYMLADATLGVMYVLVVFAVIVITTVTLRGAFSVIAGLTLAVLALLLALFGAWDELLGLIPHLSVHMNAGFYLLFSTLIFLHWAAMLFVFDKFQSWRIRPGQMTERRLIGQSERSYDTRGLLFEHRSDDFFRHTLLGLGAGDLYLITSGGREEKVHIPNVLFVERKVDAIQRLVAVQPDDLVEDSD